MDQVVIIIREEIMSEGSPLRIRPEQILHKDTQTLLNRGIPYDTIKRGLEEGLTLGQIGLAFSLSETNNFIGRNYKDTE